jgi:hypothetical protein
MAKRQTIQWPKDRQYNGQKTHNTMAKRQTIQWPKDRQYNDQKTDNTMTKRKGTKGQTVVVKTLHRKLKIE